MHTFTHRFVRIVSLLLIGLFIICASGYAETQWPDSLRKHLQTLPDSSRLLYLEKLANDHALEYDYIQFYRQEAERQQDADHLARALSRQANYYYVEKEDALAPFVEEVEPLLIKMNHPVELIQILRLNLYLLVRHGKNQEVLDGVEKMKTLSREMDYPIGIEMADQNLAYFYFLNNMPEDGERVYLDVLDRMEKRKAPLVQQIALLVQLFQFTPGDNRMTYVKKAEDYIAELRKDPEAAAASAYQLSRYDYSVQFSNAWELIRLGEFPKALEHINQLEILVKENDMEIDRQIGLDQLYNEYYMKLASVTDNPQIKEGYIRKSINYIDNIIELGRQQNMLSAQEHYMSQKASIYYDLGNYKEVVDLQKEIMLLKDSINKTGYQESLADMRTRYEVDKLEMEKVQAEIEAKQMRTQLMLWIGGCIFLIVLVGGLLFMTRIAQRGKAVMAEAKEKAEAADRLKSTFLANMNHEIRTPLNAIVGFSQILVDEEDRERRQEFSHIIENNNELLQTLIGDVLDISKIESNTISLYYKKQSLEAMMKEIYDMIRLRVSPSVELLLDPCEELVVETDRSRLIQVLTNLLTNAVKHTHTGHIRFGYERKGSEVLFYVEDTGEGIPKEEQEAIFNRFAQLQNGKKGVGLGLAICKGLVTQMGGRIWVESTPKKGSTFYVRIPQDKPEKRA
ncbi:HAMP domain-containing histidine kinase [Parabacteroides sp. OttesenSCG-928-O15]|nr:HAMP domain-containing histidine kinase [Parabacteroides sp. OttesenSCG-928-O15]